MAKRKKVARKQKVRKERDPGAIFIVVGVLAGTGIGMFVNQTGAGALIGLAAGFLVYAIVKLMKKK